MTKYRFIVERVSRASAEIAIDADDFQQAAKKFAEFTQKHGSIRWGEDANGGLMYDGPSQCRVAVVGVDGGPLEGYPNAAHVDSPVWRGIGDNFDVDDMPDAIRALKG